MRKNLKPIQQFVEYYLFICLVAVRYFILMFGVRIPSSLKIIGGYFVSQLLRKFVRRQANLLQQLFGDARTCLCPLVVDSHSAAGIFLRAGNCTAGPAVCVVLRLVGLRLRRQLLLAARLIVGAAREAEANESCCAASKQDFDDHELHLFPR